MIRHQAQKRALEQARAATWPAAFLTLFAFLWGAPPPGAVQATEREGIARWEPVCDDDTAAHNWQPQPQQAALMLVFAHPDDEVLFFRGTIPYYSMVRGLPLVAICMANNDQVSYDLARRAELRNALWTCGMRNEPLFGNFPDDCYAQPLQCTLDSWGLDNAVRYVTEQIRRYRPEVVLTHDLDGEYGHANHMVTALATVEAYFAASDPARYPEQLIELEVWQPLKLYVHLHDENFWVHDWDTPYPELGGRTPQEMAASGLACHESQDMDFFEYGGHVFGLYATQVGLDAGSSDFFENIIPVITQATADVTDGTSPLTVNFTGAASDHPDDTLTFNWDFSDGNFATGAQVSHVFDTNGAYPARLRVSDGTHVAESEPILIRVGVPPQGTVVAPLDGTVFRAGDLINFIGTAVDPDGVLTDENLSWTVTLHHDGISHVVAGPLIGAGGVFQIPESSVDFANALGYEFTLTVTDADGLIAVDSVLIVPDIVSVTLDTLPTGLAIEFDGTLRPTPFIIRTLVGLQHAIGAPATQCRDFEIHTFDYWSDGGAAAHTISAPDSASTITAAYLACGHCGQPLLTEDFNTASAGDQPPNWLDTGPNNSLNEDDHFQVQALDEDLALGTVSAAINIHSHHAGSGAAAWTNYEFSGRMRMSSRNAGIGVTFLSDYPNTDAYYRLRRYHQAPFDAFHISPHGTDITGGITNSGIVPDADEWYWFRIDVVDTGSRTEIRARVWADGSLEPVDWQIDCFDAGADRRTAGTVGAWSMSSGIKYWDDLVVAQLVTDNTCDDDNPCTAHDACSNGVCVGELLDCTAWDTPCTIGVCNPSTGACEPHPANENGPCSDGAICTEGDACSNGVCAGTPLDCADGNPCTDDTCDADLGCVHEFNTNGCDDADACTENDVCLHGVCTGTPVECDDGIACTVDSCDSSAHGCVHEPNDAACSDEVFCNGVENCDALLGCQAGSPPCGPGAWCAESLVTCFDHGDGDFDNDGDVDLWDFSRFTACMGQSAFDGCNAANLMGTDEWVDLDDYIRFCGKITGPE